MVRVEADWTVEQVLEEQRRWEASQPHEARKFYASPVAQWDALHSLATEQKAFADGDKRAAMHAVYLCCSHDLPIPDWAAKAFITGYQKVLGCNVATWDEAFGPPFRKGFRIHDARKRREQWPQIGPAVVKAILEDRMPIDPGLFEQVGERLGIGARQVRDTWYGPQGVIFRKQVKSVLKKEAAETRRAGRPARTSR